MSVPLSLTSTLVSVDGLILLVGVVLLYFGAELLVTSASKLALGFGIKAATIGVTIVAFATTAPELFVSLFGGLTVSDDIGLGNIVGSNIANIGLVLGASALVKPLSVDRDLLVRHGPFMLAAAVLLVLLGLDGELATLDGVLMLGLLAVFTGYAIRDSRGSDDPVTDEVDLAELDDAVTARDVATLLGALGLLLLGAHGLIEGSVNILAKFGFSDLFIGLTVVAFGTSLPEFATSVIGAARDEAEFSIGNVVGSNIYNVLAVIGLLAVLVPIDVSVRTRSLHFPVMIAFTVGAMAIMAHRDRVTRPNGVLLIGGYLGFVYVLLP